MALVHDIAECIVGDITPHDDISVAEKHMHEQVCLHWANMTVSCLPVIKQWIATPKRRDFMQSAYRMDHSLINTLLC